MCIYKYTKDTHEALKKLQPELKRSLQPHLNAPSKKVANEQAMTLTAKALPSLVSSFHSVFKSAAQTNCRHLDMAVIKSVFAVLKQAIDEIRLDYLLATKFKKQYLRELTSKIKPLCVIGATNWCTPMVTWMTRHLRNCYRFLTIFSAYCNSSVHCP